MDNQSVVKVAELMISVFQANTMELRKRAADERYYRKAKQDHYTTKLRVRYRIQS